MRVLALRRDLLQGIPHEPLHVIGPKQLKFFLDSYKRLEDLDMQFIDCKSTTEHNKRNVGDIEWPSVVEESYLHCCSMSQIVDIVADNHADFSSLRSLNEVLKEAGLESLTSFPVVHCPDAFGVVLKATERTNNTGTLIPGWKVVYSGDTRPCMEVVRASLGATLLIHEATFDDCLADEAVARNHSTTEEAMKVGESAGVYRIVLTHFSQSYPKIPSIDDKNWHKACIGFDFMSVNMADLPAIPLVLPHLKLLFRSDLQ